MLERTIEQYLVKAIEHIGGIAMKFTSPQRRSVPDRLVLLPGGMAFFVECKAPGKKPTEAQEREHKRLRNLGFVVTVVDSKAAVIDLIADLTEYQDHTEEESYTYFNRYIAGDR